MAAEANQKNRPRKRTMMTVPPHYSSFYNMFTHNAKKERYISKMQSFSAHVEQNRSIGNLKNDGLSYYANKEDLKSNLNHHNIKG